MDINLSKDQSKKYFYTDGQHQYGPFSLDELQAQSISRETKIWYQGLENWTPAKDLPELAAIFQAPTPPAYNNPAPPPPYQQAQSSYEGQQPPYQQQQPYQQPYQQSGVPPKTWLMESILATIFCCLPFGIAGIIYASKVESKFYSGDVAGAEQASLEARKWTMVSFWVQLGFIIVYLLFILVIGIGAASSSNY